MAFSRISRLFAIVAILSALLVTVSTTVSAANATIDVGGAPLDPGGFYKAPFSTTPGQAATITLNLTANNNTPVEICVSDNGGPFIPTGIKTAGNGTASGSANYIQSGTYTFGAFTSTSAGSPTASPPVAPSCSGEILGARVLVKRAGPTGAAGVDDFTLTVSADTAISGFAPPFPGVVNTLDILISRAQNFPILATVCFMSGDGTAKQVNVQQGQDPRVLGSTPITFFGFTFAGAVVTNKVNVAGQNGCYQDNFIVNSFYNFGLAAQGQAGNPIPGAAQGTITSAVGFCRGGNRPNQVSNNPFNFDRHCSQVAYSATIAGVINDLTGAGGNNGLGPLNPGNTVTLPSGTTITGSAVTGALNHAIEVCAYLATPTSTGTALTGTTTSSVQSYNQSGAINITPLTASQPVGTVLLLATYDVFGNTPGGGGVGAAQQPCPSAVTTFQTIGGGTLPGPGGGITDVVRSIIPANSAAMQLLDERFLVVG